MIEGTAEGATLLLGAMVSLAVVLLLAWFVLRWMGHRLPMQTGSSGRQIEILDRATIAPDKFLVLVRVAEKTLLVGISANTVENLCEIQDPDGVLDSCAQEQKNKFSSLLGEYISQGVFRSKKEESD